MPTYIHIDPSLGNIEVDTLVLNLVDRLVDAGEVAATMEAVISDLDFVGIASFDSDPLYDFRAQRPIATYADGRLADIAYPSMDLKLVTDVQGRTFLYISGQEPDFHWPVLARDIVEIATTYNISHLYSFGGMPAPVPHTRPADMVVRSTQPRENEILHAYVEHYATLADMVENEAGKRGLAATSIRTRVPAYLARADQPFFSAALAVAKMLASLGGPVIPVGDLEQRVDEQMAFLAAAVESNPELAELVTNLEDEYDKLPEGVGFVRNDDPTIPTSDEIGEAVERFLEMREEKPLEEAVKKSKAKNPPVRRGRHSWRTPPLEDTAHRSTAHNDDDTESPTSGDTVE
ncbi:PAC2 family protein [Arcanobacterium canis]|uniref:PAC2 family protein n=1 Tax=Arcanobacterium canis TaxID=999183 RepID=A0ABY8G0T7_9ACTO|nr:PAC2 family protein [Arcanobacterium canis]WFM82816.1 PAC2 family protein [Arcanobacterium canis]